MIREAVCSLNSRKMYTTTSAMSSSNSEKDVKNQLSKMLYVGEKLILGERKYPLNKSKTKFVTVGLVYEYGFAPGIKLTGIKNDTIIFNEAEWNSLLRYQYQISKNFYSNEVQEIKTENFSIYFDEIYSCRVVQICKNDSYIYMQYDTISKLWEVLPLIKHLVELLKLQHFQKYLQVLKMELQNHQGNIFTNAYKILHTSENCPSENIAIAIELLDIYPDAFEKIILQKI